MRVLLIRNPFVTLHEGLSLPEKSIVDEWVDDIGSHPLHGYDPHHHLGHMFTDHVFTGKDPHRVTIPVGDGSHADSRVKQKIQDHLKSFGYSVKDYKKGIASKGNRELKIGKLLNKGDTKHEELQKGFSHDPSRADSTSDYSDHHIVISRHPHDVAGMSSCDKPWKSCMNFDSGSERQHLYHEVKGGTMIAYLAHKDDIDAEKPLGRIAIRPHLSEKGHRIYRAEGESNVYGKAAGGGLHQAVRNWALSKFPAKDGHFYRRAPHTYVEYPGPKPADMMGKMDPTKMSHDDMSKYIYRSKEGMPTNHFDHIMKHGSDANREELTTVVSGKEHLGKVAKHTPEHLLGSPVFAKHTNHKFTNPDTGKQETITGHDLLHKAPAHHAEAAIPGIGKHLEKVANSTSTNAHNQMLAIAKSNPTGIAAQHRDSIHRRIVDKLVTGSDEKDKQRSAEGAVANISSIVPHVSKDTFNHIVGKIKRGADSHRPGKAKSNWVHHAIDSSQIGGHRLRNEARSLVMSLRKSHHYDSSQHKSTIFTLATGKQ